MSDRRIRQTSRLLTSLCCCVLFAIPAVSSAKNDLDRLELLGAVHTVITKQLQLTTTHEFDRDGHLTSLDLVPANDANSARYVYQYDESGRLIEEQTFEPDHSIAYRKLFRYGTDERGRQTAQVAVTDKGLLAHAEFFFYDDRGLLTEELLITAQGVAEKSLFDARGNLVYHARYFQGRLVLEATHHYDPLDRLKESRFYGSDGDPIRRDHYRYDQAGQRIEHSSQYLRQSHLRKSVVTYEFDQAGNWIKETTQRWTDKGGTLAIAETIVSRERVVTYY